MASHALSSCLLYAYTAALGCGRHGEFRLADAVQAFAACPDEFPPLWLPTTQQSFVDGAQKTAGFMVLSDGRV